MKKIRIGIPRALLYYRHHILWKKFFEKLNCKVILSPTTNKDIVNIGISNSVDESCLSAKIYLGHVLYLQDKCDYILISRISDYGKGEKVCVRFNGLYDNIKNMDLPCQLLNYNIEHTKLHYEFIEFIRIGLKINKNIFKVIYSYMYAKRKEKQHRLSLENEQINITKNNNKKVLIVSHPYNIYDKYLGTYIIDYFTKNNISILYADRLNRKISKNYAYGLSNTLYWTYAKEQIGAIEYYKNIISGIIFISTYPCGVDSLVNELMLKKINNIPTINIILDESTKEIGLETRLESFLDIIKEEKTND